jgi:hypothetical protein
VTNLNAENSATESHDSRRIGGVVGKIEHALLIKVAQNWRFQ